MSNFNELKKDAKEIQEKTNDLYNDSKDNASSMYEEIKDRTEAKAHDIKESVQEMYEGSRKKMNNLQDCVSDYSDELIKTVKDKPLTSILIAGGIGFILAALAKK